SICRSDGTLQQDKSNALSLSQTTSVISDLAIKASPTEDPGEATVKLIDTNVIKGDLSILGLEKMKQIVGLFEESSRITLREMAEASNLGNGREVKSLAHKLKGSAGSLGLLQLYNACQVIE
ncbi:Hpt domain-containing protein, partial [Vibrio sp. 10N.222.55.E8]